MLFSKPVCSRSVLRVGLVIGFGDVIARFPVFSGDARDQPCLHHHHSLPSAGSPFVPHRCRRQNSLTSGAAMVAIAAMVPASYLIQRKLSSRPASAAAPPARTAQAIAIHQPERHCPASSPTHIPPESRA